MSSLASSPSPPPPHPFLPVRYYAQGARFAKWRAVLKVDDALHPSSTSVLENAHGLARYAQIAQVRRRGTSPQRAGLSCRHGRSCRHGLSGEVV